MVPLNISFRSTRPVLDAVNAVFGGRTARDGVIAGGAWPVHETVARRPGGAGGAVAAGRAGRRPRSRCPGQLPLEPRPGDSPRAAPGAARRGFHRRPDRRAASELESRERAGDGGRLPGAGAPAQRFVDELVRALKARSVPVAGIDRLVLTEHIAVMDLMALGQFLLLPDDDLTLATVLKSPFIGLAEDALFDLAYDARRQSLWSVLSARAGERADFAAAHRYLGGAAGAGGFRPAVRSLCRSARAAAAGGGRCRRGWDSRRCDPIDEFLDLALAYEREHVPSLQGFLHWLASGAVEMKRELDERPRDQVRIMTVHGAKGLQAPIVILPDTIAAAAAAGESAVAASAMATRPATCCSGRRAPAWTKRSRGAARADRARAPAWRNIAACSMWR